MTANEATVARELCDLAQALALDAGRLALEMADTARRSPETKSTITDVVTLADSAAEKLIVAGIERARADDGILGEEGTATIGRNGVIWHIDPIDGTTNYLYGIPAFSVSVAAEVDGSVVAGVVYDPSLDRLIRAVTGEGAWCNGSRLQVNAKDDLATALLATGFGYSPQRRRHQAEVLVEIIPQVRDIRRFGSAALDLCAVATGEVDGYFERGLNKWDLAAGALIAAEAGAIVENLRGGPPDSSFVLACGPNLFRALREPLLASAADIGP